MAKKDSSIFDQSSGIHNLIEISGLIIKINTSINLARKNLILEQIHLLENEEIILDKLQKIMEISEKLSKNKDLNSGHKMNKITKILKENIENPHLINIDEIEN